MKAWLRLLRVSLAPSAAADPVAGLLLALGAFPSDPRAWLLVPASLGVYHGALALNDWHDREHDARTRPARPIPSGGVSPRAALAVALALLGMGVACAWIVSSASGAVMTGVALLAVAYDLVGRGPWSGPLLLGACRAGNVSAGIVPWLGTGEAAVADPLRALLPAAVYGLYVVVVGRLGRMEDGEDGAPLGARPRVHLVLAALVLVSLPLAAPGGTSPAGIAAAALVALAGAAGLVHAAWRPAPWSRGDVERAMGVALRRLLVASAAIALLALRPGARGGWDALVAAAVILLGFPLAHALRRVVPPS